MYCMDRQDTADYSGRDIRGIQRDTAGYRGECRACAVSCSFIIEFISLGTIPFRMCDYVYRILAAVGVGVVACFFLFLSFPIEPARRRGSASRFASYSFFWHASFLILPALRSGSLLAARNFPRRHNIRAAHIELRAQSTLAQETQTQSSARRRAKHNSNIGHMGHSNAMATKTRRIVGAGLGRTATTQPAPAPARGTPIAQ